MRSRRSIGQWSATTDGARHGVSWCPHSPVQTHSGSRCSTARRKARCPALAYGLPLGRRARSPCALQVGHAPTPSWRVGHPGLEQTRLAIVLASFGEADDVAVWAHHAPPTVHQGVHAHVAPLLGHASVSFRGVAVGRGELHPSSGADGPACQLAARAGLPPAVQLSAALSLPVHGRVAEGHKRAVGQAVPEDACQLEACRGGRVADNDDTGTTAGGKRLPRSVDQGRHCCPRGRSTEGVRWQHLGRSRAT